MTTHASGAPFRSEELGSAEVLASVGPYTACADDPPGTPISPTLPPASRVVIELETVTRDVRATTVAGVRRLADADRRIGAACATVANSRFEEGTEHLWSYSYEHAIGAHPVHGETASFAVCALAHARGNEPERSLDIVSAAGTRADRIDLESEERMFHDCVIGLAASSRAEAVDVPVADVRPISSADATRVWELVARLARTGGG
jgi:hypothetical protein